MSFRQRLATMAPHRETVLTIGVFDGVHRGHCHLLARLIERAMPSHVPTVITFTNHPATVLRPDFKLNYINTPEQKVRLLHQQGIELVIPLDFTTELSQIDAKEFITVVSQTLQMKGLIIGPDFAMGKDRQGNSEYLREMGLSLGFWVETVDSLILEGAPVRSRRVREAIGAGDVATSAQLLGRNFSLKGNVVRGDQRGRELGFPTANINVTADIMLPGDGIYATWAIVEGKRYAAATSIGIRPTFGLTERLVEVYILDFDADIYGNTIGVEFVKKLRNQETFDNIEALVKQIHLDVSDTRSVLASHQAESQATDGGTGNG